MVVSLLFYGVLSYFPDKSKLRNVTSFYLLTFLLVHGAFSSELVYISLELKTKNQKDKTKKCSVKLSTNKVNANRGLNRPLHSFVLSCLSI